MTDSSQQDGRKSRTGLDNDETGNGLLETGYLPYT